ncbi:hypothetical protein C8R48DRAFT_768694 [Suillus tomentosus]|nr:hypothetical protein C8R48DRAFT_768694 [Suillus tomentosus]
MSPPFNVLWGHVILHYFVFICGLRYLNQTVAVFITAPSLIPHTISPSLLPQSPQHGKYTEWLLAPLHLHIEDHDKPAEYIFESHANIIENKPSIIINVEQPPCLSGTDFVHQIVDPLKVNTMLEMQDRFPDVVKAIRTKIFTDWSILPTCRLTPTKSSLPPQSPSRIPAPPCSSSQVSHIPHSPSALPQSQIPVGRRVNGMQSLGPPPRVGLALQVVPQTSQTPSREPIQHRQGVNVVSTTSTPLTRGGVHAAATPSHPAQPNRHTRSRLLSHSAQVHIVADPVYALPAARHPGISRQV